MASVHGTHILLLTTTYVKTQQIGETLVCRLVITKNALKPLRISKIIYKDSI